MSIKHAKELTGGSDQPENDSVYDFLYQDARRIGSFLSQFDSDGHLTALVRTRSIIETSGSTYEAGGSVGVPTIANLNATGTQNASSAAGDSSAKTYDPLWQNSLALLDYLQQRRLICREVPQARIGQFALATGSLACFDISIMKALFSSEKVASVIAKSMSDKEEKESKTKLSSAERKVNASSVQAILKELPYGVQLFLNGDSFSVWASLRGQSLELSVDDLVLKHGAYIAGEWSMLGIVDALPDGDLPADTSSFGEGELVKHVAELFTNLRPKLGRPAKSYGMTPLLIFRKVFAEDSPAQ